MLACAVLAATGCGGNDEDDIRQTMRDFVTALNERDADKFCDDLVTKEFVEKQTFAKGGKALADCKRTLKQIKGLKVTLVRVTSLKVEGDDATVKAVLQTNGQESDQLYRLKKEDGGWRISAGSGA
jgi:ketosteroid isomerase-like protein